MDRRAKRDLMERLERDARRLCARFRLRYRVLEAERANVKRRYGVCFSDGTIRIRLIHAATGRPLKYSSLVNTLCHELAHLRHFNHGPRFQAFYAEILGWARREGIYRPGPARPDRVGRDAGAGEPGSRPGAAPVARRRPSEPVLGLAARAATGRPPPRGPSRPISAQLELFTSREG